MKSPSKAAGGRREGFTLVELLVVILIIVLVSAATLPSIISSFNHRKVSEAARILQASLVGARDAAIRANGPRGIRLLPDPVFSGGSQALAANRIIPIEPGPDHRDGLVTILLANLPTTTDPRISVNESVFFIPPDTVNGTPASLPNPPTNWYWNIRQGDKISFGDSGRQYTIAGPMRIGPINLDSTAGGANPERFVNVGGPQIFGYNGANSPNPFTKGYEGGERLYLVNGQDDDNDGWIDEGFDGIDNDADGIIDPGFNGIDDDGDGNVDNVEELTFTLNANTDNNEFEAEQFVGSQFGTQFVNKSYTITRRPVVSDRAVEVALPEGVVIDLTTWNAALARSANGGASLPSSPERSRLPVDPYSLFVDIMITQNGQVLLPGGGQGTVNSGGNNPQSNTPFYHFWIAEREDVFPPLFGTVNTTPGQSGVGMRNVPVANPNYGAQTPVRFLLPMPNDNQNGYVPSAYGLSNEAYLKGDRRLVTLFTRTGLITSNEVESFNVQNTNVPYLAPQLGTREVK